MPYKKRVFSISLLLLLFGCGGGGSTTQPNTTSEMTQSFKGLELYNFNLDLVENQRQYNTKKIDPISAEITPQYYKFSTKSFIQDTTAHTLFVNAKRNSTEDIHYQLNSKGEIEENINDILISTLSYEKKESFSSQEFTPYKSKISIQGEKYLTKKSYQSDIIIVDKLASNSTFDSIESFRDNYGSKPFIGSINHGLFFGTNNQLLELKDGNLTKNGSYEIKKLSGQKTLLISPNNPEIYYANHTCYILDFARVWQGRCYEKESNETIEFYDRAIFEDVQKYLQNSFVEFNLSI
jgi:hypothetical protein